MIFINCRRTAEAALKHYKLHYLAAAEARLLKQLPMAAVNSQFRIIPCFACRVLKPPLFLISKIRKRVFFQYFQPLRGGYNHTGPIITPFLSLQSKPPRKIALLYKGSLKPYSDSNLYLGPGLFPLLCFPVSRLISGVTHSESNIFTQNQSLDYLYHLVSQYLD